MNWIRENKFIAIFGGIVAALSIGLAVMLYLAIGQREEVAGQYNTAAAQLHTLQAMQPYPEQKNLQKLVAQKNEYVASIGALQAKLAAMQYPMEAIEPAQFQDLLKAEVSKAADKAKNNGTTLPENFYFGFSEYQSSPPLREAAGPLAKELRAVSFVIDQLLNAKVAAITDVTRVPLPIEAKAVATPTPRGAAAARGKNGPSLLLSKPFEISFLAEQGKFRAALNGIGAAHDQFMSIRNLRVENEQQKSPPRVDPNAAIAPAPGAPTLAPDQADPSGIPAAGTGAENPANAWLKPVLGREKVNVTLTIDIVDFAEPAAVPASK